MSRGSGGHDLNFLSRQPAHLLDQEQIRGLGHRDGQHAAHAKQRQHQIVFDVFAGQQFDHFGIVQPGFELGVGHAVLIGQALDHLVFRAKALLDQNFTQQPAAAFLGVLRFQCALQRFRGEIAAFDEQIAQPRRC